MTDDAPVFVTGGTGFLGVNLVRLLVARGRRVRVLRRAPGRVLGLDGDRVEFVPGDVTDVGAIHTAMRGCAEVYHVAARVEVAPWGVDRIRAVNVDGTRNVCAAALHNGVRRLVHTSSIATIAAGTLDAPADEDTAWNLERLRIPYYTTKRDAEAVVREYVDRGLDAVIVNPTYLVGPWDVKPSAGRMVIPAATGTLHFFPRRGGINFVDVRHAAEGHVLAMERGVRGARYILGGENLSFRVFLARVADQAGAPAPRLALSYAAMYPVAAAGSVVGRLGVDRWRDVNLCVLRSACLEHYVTSENARATLRFPVSGVDDAIGDAIAWFREHGYMPHPRGVASRPSSAPGAG
ncbi:MAG: NAD-dependent epimerase/dehydratase family protein [Phycisphaerae bacterium]